MSSDIVNTDFQGDDCGTESYSNCGIDEHSYELQKIEDEIDKIDDCIYRYIEDCSYIWDSRIAPFMKSHDCHVMEKLDCVSDNEFVKFMMSQKTFKIMITAHDRLVARKEYILRKRST